MKTRTDLHAGRAPTEREILNCLAKQKDLSQKIDSLENRLNAPFQAASTAPQPVDGAYPVPGSYYQGSFYPDWSGYCG